MATVIGLLPRDTKPPLIRKLDPDASPIMTLVLSGDETPRELYEMADRDVKDAIESVGGVGEVRSYGGQKRAINVWVDANRLAAYRIPILQVRDAVARQNSDIPGGRVDAGPRELVLRTLGRFADRRCSTTSWSPPSTARRCACAISAMPRTATRSSARRLATTAGPRWRCEVRRQSGANTVAVIDGVKERLARVQRTAAAGRAARNRAGPVALHRSGFSRSADCT